MGYIDRAVDPYMLLTLEVGDDDGRAARFGRFRRATRAVSAASSSFLTRFRAAIISCPDARESRESKSETADCSVVRASRRSFPIFAFSRSVALIALGGHPKPASMSRRTYWPVLTRPLRLDRCLPTLGKRLEPREGSVI